MCIAIYLDLLKIENTAVWQTGKVKTPLVVKTAPHTKPREHEIVIRNYAITVNPIDWIVRDLGNLIFPWIKYPSVLGWDVDGKIVELGPGASERFKIGDRVFGLAVGKDKDRNSPAEGALQSTTVLTDSLCSPIAEQMSFEKAVVIPLGISWFF